jgi:hypothetical protein
MVDRERFESSQRKHSYSELYKYILGGKLIRKSLIPHENQSPEYHR